MKKDTIFPMQTVDITRSTFTANEAAAFVQLPHHRVRQEIDDRVISTNASDNTLSFATLIYLRAFKDVDFCFPISVRKKCWLDLTELLQQNNNVRKIGITDFFTLEIDPVKARLLKRIQQFTEWKKALVSDSAVMGGAVVFPHSRLTVRHVGKMLDRGESRDVIIEDYPHLTDTDLTFSQLYVRAYPSD